MSDSLPLLPCPLCANPCFGSADKLRSDLINVATKHLQCPICDESVLGLDKLTIHLFCHVQKSQCLEINNGSGKGCTTKVVDPSERKKNNKSPIENLGHCKDNKQITLNGRSRDSNNKTVSSSSINNKFVKIRPKLSICSINTLPIFGLQTQNEAKRDLCITNDVRTSVLCNICGFSFVDENILNMHNSLMHSCETSNHKRHPFPCHLCSKAFNMKGSLMIHLRVAHFGFRHNNKRESKSKEIVCDSTNLATEKPKLANVDESEDANVHFPGQQSNKQWICEICHKLFTTKYFLKKHKRLHTGETPYSCTQCGKTFTFQQSYHKHVLYHNNDKPHTCGHCGRSFKELSTLHNHERIHTGEKPFSCETCGKTFRQRVSYLVHKRIHTGVMPYKCTACDKSFRYKVSQRTHKCTAQPPGTVVRQSGDLIQKLIKIKSEQSVDISSSKSANKSIKNSSKIGQNVLPDNDMILDALPLFTTQPQINNNICFGDELMDSSLIKWNFELIDHSATDLQNKVENGVDNLLYSALQSPHLTNESLPSQVDLITSERLKSLSLNTKLKYESDPSVFKTSEENCINIFK